MAITYTQDVRISMYVYNSKNQLEEKVPIDLNYIICDFTFEPSVYVATFWAATTNCKFGLYFLSADPYLKTGKKIKVK
jgi:hypothetical protein